MCSNREKEVEPGGKASQSVLESAALRLTSVRSSIGLMSRTLNSEMIISDSVFSVRSVEPCVVL